MYKLIHISRKGNELDIVNFKMEKFNKAIADGYTTIVSHKTSQAFDKFGDIQTHTDSFVLSKPTIEQKKRTIL
jgi:hypothetical protein